MQQFRSIVHTQRFQLGQIALILATGTPDVVTDHVQEQVPNKLSLLATGVRKDGVKAMALYVDGDIDDSTKQTTISSDVVKSILGGYKLHKWNFFSMFTAMKNKIDAAIGGSLLNKIRAVQQYAQDFAKVVFGLGGYVAGAGNETCTLLLIAPDGSRAAYGWNHETLQDKTFPQPYGDALTRYTVAGDALLAIKAGTGQSAGFSGKQVKDMIEGGEIQSWQHFTDLAGCQIDDVTLGIDNGKGSQTVIATGRFGVDQALKMLEIGHNDDGTLRLNATTQKPVAIDDETASYGVPVRYDGQGVTFVDRNGGRNSVTRVPATKLPKPLQDAFASACA